MTIRTILWTSLSVLALALVLQRTGAAPANSADNAAQNAVPVHMVVTVESLKDDDRVSAMKREDVKVRIGKDKLPVSAWIPSRGDQAGLQLFILIDETSNTSLGVHLDDLRRFIRAQAPATFIGLGYMRNTTVNILSNLTKDHEQVAKVLRLPLGTTGASDSVYLSLMALMKGWPENKVRREVLLITDGIDRFRRYDYTPMGMATMSPNGPTMNPGMRITMTPAMGAGPGGMPYISPDVDQASLDAQRYGVIVHSIYAPGVGRMGRNYWDVNNGQNSIAKLADETGGESFYLGVQNPVSFQPYLERLQKILDNQYFLVFQAVPRKKADLQRVKIDTEVAKVEIVSADNVWVPAGRQTGKQN